MFRLFWKSVSCLNPLGSFPSSLCSPLIVMCAVFWVHVSESISACMSMFPISSTQVKVWQMAMALHQALCSAVCRVQVASFTSPTPVWDNSQTLWSVAVTARGWFVQLVLYSSFPLYTEPCTRPMLSYWMLWDFTSVSGMFDEVICHDLNKLRTITQNMIFQLGWNTSNHYPIYLLGEKE